MVDASIDGFGNVPKSWLTISEAELCNLLVEPNDKRCFAISLALQRGIV